MQIRSKLEVEFILKNFHFNYRMISCQCYELTRLNRAGASILWGGGGAGGREPPDFEMGSRAGGGWGGRGGYASMSITQSESEQDMSIA